MQATSVIKVSHYILTVVLIVVVLIMGAMLYILSPSTSDSKLFRIEKIGEDAAVYVTINNSGNATVPIIYRYYIDNIEFDRASIIKKLNNSAPFLITNDEGAIKSIRDGIVRIGTSGKVYSFNNLTGYYLNNEFRSVSVYFDAY